MRVRAAVGLLIVPVLCAAVRVAAAQNADPLVRAHEQYNQQHYDDAIRLATDARKIPAEANAAAVVLARAHLERYRQSREAADLDAARGLLTPLDRGTLAPRERRAWNVAMGQLLYFDGRFTTAAEFFDLALINPTVDQLEAGGRDRLLEWWAMALDQQAQLGPPEERRVIYQRLLARVEDERRRDDRSPVAAYWMAAAAAGTGDFDRAWAAAEAAWLLSAAGPQDHTKLRADLDTLISTVIVRERARFLSPTDPQPAMASLQQQWEGLKQRYGR